MVLFKVIPKFFHCVSLLANKVHSEIECKEVESSYLQKALKNLDISEATFWFINGHIGARFLRWKMRFCSPW